MCGAEGGPCCGVSSCDDGLACLAGTCTSSTCGGAYQTCCTVGMDCGPGLMCDVGSCVPDSMMADGGLPISDCGMRGAVCCSTDPPCGVGLACLGGSCMDEPPCGSEAMTCCAGDVCLTGNVCVEGVCRREVAIPMCTASGGACSASVECCSTNCSGGTCAAGGPPPPPPPPPGGCGSAFSCFDCVLDDGCGWCDGTCTAATNRSGCSDFRADILECVL